MERRGCAHYAKSGLNAHTVNDGQMEVILQTQCRFFYLFWGHCQQLGLG